MKLKVFTCILVLFLLSLGWLLFFRDPLPREISYYHSLTGKAVASVNSIEALNMVMADMLLHGEDPIRISIKDITVTTELLGKVVEKAFSSNEDYYLRNSANYWEYLAEPDPSGSTLKIRIFYQENKRQRK